MLSHRFPGGRPRWLAVAAASLLPTMVGGCAAADQVSHRLPFLSAHTEREQTAVAGCISHRWHRTFGFRTRTAQEDDHTSVLLYTGNVTGIDMIATVYTGRVEVRERRTAWGFLHGDLKQAAEECL